MEEFEKTVGNAAGAPGRVVVDVEDVVAGVGDAGAAGADVGVKAGIADATPGGAARGGGGGVGGG